MIAGRGSVAANAGHGSDIAQGIKVVSVTLPSEELAQSLEALLRQLSSQAPRATLDRLAEVVNCPSVTLFLAMDRGTAVGMLTLTMLPLLSGRRARIEDVVVAEAYRRRGIGALLVARAVSTAAETGARTVDLTARPDHPDAVRLYTRFGFKRRESDLYRLEPSALDPGSESR